MARGRKSGPSRLDLRRENEAVEARDREEGDETAEVEEIEVDDDDDADEPDAEVEAADDADAGDGDDDDDSPKPKKKAKAKVKAPAKAKAPAKPRKARVKEVPRMKAVWVVYDNSGKSQGEFPYNQKGEAEALLARKIEEKKQTFYLQMIKQPIEA